MRVSRLLCGLTFLMVAALMVGSACYSQTPLMDFAASNISYQLIRGAILAVLAILFVWSPPRSLIFRAVLASCAVILIGATLYCLFINQTNLVDMMVFMEVAIIFAIESLELRDNPIVLSSLPARKSRRALNSPLS